VDSRATSSPGPPRAWRILALAGYAAIVLFATLADFGLDATPEAVAFRLRRAVLVELDPRSVVDAVRNATLFAGWGLVWCLVAAPEATTRRLLGRAVASGALLSTAIEIAQLLSSNRTSSVLDIATDVLGAALGTWVTQAIVGRLRQEREAASSPPVWLLAGSYAVAVLGEAAIPLSREAVAPYGPPARRLAAAWAALLAEPWARLVPSDVLLFVPAGALAVWALSARGWGGGRSALSVVVAGAIGVAAAEAAHGPLGLRLGLAPVLGHAGGIALGALAAAALRRRLPGGGWLAMSAYALLLLAWDWRPFVLEQTVEALRAKLAAVSWQPMMAQYLLGADLYSVADVVIGFALFLPLGAWLARRPLAGRGLLSGAWPAAWLAVVGELGQLAVHGRYVDVTDPMVEAAGAVVGWLVMRRAGGASSPPARGSG
jgi:VanZ family protein